MVSDCSRAADGQNDGESTRQNMQNDMDTGCR